MPDPKLPDATTMPAPKLADATTMPAPTVSSSARKASVARCQGVRVQLAADKKTCAICGNPKHW